jgi:hypothetical protein
VPLIAESPAYGPDSRAVVWRDHKLIVRSDGVELLFDLRSDPGESRNLRHEMPQVAGALREILTRELAGASLPGSARAEPLDEETKRQLRALGYLWLGPTRCIQAPYHGERESATERPVMLPRSALRTARKSGIRSGRRDRYVGQK